jgi:hypothetical protein
MLDSGYGFNQVIVFTDVSDVQEETVEYRRRPKRKYLQTSITQLY